MQRLRSSGSSVLRTLAVPQLKRKALNSWAAAQDTYFSIKDVFERHRVVFAIGTSMASVVTAWTGYSIRHFHETKIDQRLTSIEEVMKKNHHVEHAEFKKIVHSSTASCIATAGTTLVLGYALGWRGGRWYANRKFKKEQMKLLGQVKPKRWQLLGRIKPKVPQLQFLRRTLTRPRLPESPAK